MKDTAKCIGKYLLRIVSVALIIALLVVLLPHIGTLIGYIFPSSQLQMITSSQRLSQEMRDMGVLQFAEYTETGTFVSELPALFFGSVQTVSAPYSYTIPFGVDLEKADIAYEDNIFTITLPPVTCMADTFTVTGDAQVKDFFFPLTADRYQQILTDQNEKLRNSYLTDDALMAQLQSTAAEKIKSIFEQLLKKALITSNYTILVQFSAE